MPSVVTPLTRPYPADEKIALKLRNHREHTSRAAFSLVEILVAVSVIILLGAIIIAMTGSVRKAAMRTECASNLRQIGIAIKSYAIDHNNRLPGPIYYTQLHSVRGGNHLATHLAPYLGYDLEGEENVVIPEFICPAVKDEFPNTNFSYLANHQMKTNVGIMDPWGNAKYEESSVTLAQLNVIVDPAQEWALIDSYGDPPVYPKHVGMEGPPLHGKTNMLFFDGHVESR